MQLRIRQHKNGTHGRGANPARRYPAAPEAAAELRETVSAVTRTIEELPSADNAAGAVEKMLRANAILRNVPWPPPYDRTIHRLHAGDARNLSWLPDESLHLVVTSPPYWTLKEYEPHQAQLGAVEDYEGFLVELDKVWRECARCWCPVGGFVVWSAMCASPGSAMAGITSCRCTRIFRCARGGWDWIV